MTPTFAEVFLKAASKLPPSSELVVSDPEFTSGGVLAICQSGEQALLVTDEGIQFDDNEKKIAKLSWQELDFILPGDLSLASDKLFAFSDMETPAKRIAETIGKWLAIAGPALFVLWLATILYGLLAPPLIWVNTHLGFIGDCIAIGVLFAFVAFASPVLIPLALGLLAAGGAVTWLSGWLGNQLRPAVRLILTKRYGNVQNGLHIVGRVWIRMPWCTPTARLVDLVMLGVKLQRRGLT